MKKLNLLFTALLLLCCVGTAKAVEVTIDGIKYDVITKAKQATVISDDTKYSGDIVIPSEITYNNVTCSVTSIENEAFGWCDGLTSVTIPNSVTSIGYSAFRECSGLTSITIPNSVTSIGDYAFAYCSGLTSVTIGNSVTSIGNYAFWYCSSLTSITIPNSVTSIGSSAFASCSGLTSITIPNSVTSIGGGAFWGCSGLTSITIPNSVTSIGKEAFRECSGLTSVTIPNSVTSIGYRAFYECSGLTSITIPNSVTSIGEQAFYECSGLTSVTIGNSVTSIGEAAFDDCTALTNIVIPSSVTSIGKWAFATCSAIETIVVDSENNVYDSRNNCNAIIETATNKLVLGCKNTVVPNDVTAIGYAAFDGCTGLTQITIPNSVTSIGNYAFNGCSGLTSITIPNSVTSFGDNAFGWCSGLTSITIPNSVTSIGNQAFSNCDNLTDVNCLATNVPSTNSNAFSSSYPEYMTLHVPAEAINSYKTTEPWSTFGNIIVYVTPKCAAPVIEYRNGELFIECDTKNAEFVTTITNDYTGNYNSNAIALTATYNISVYATATGHDNSDTVNATLCWIECDCSANDNTTDVINVPAKAVFVTSNNGTININCALEGEVVELYTIDAMHIGSTTIKNGCATIESGLSKGDIAIIKIGEKSIKVILN